VTLPLSSLKRLLEVETRGLADHSCQQCGAALPADHAHVANLETRSFLCVCHACYAAFPAADSHVGKFRAVPRRYLSLPSGAIRDEQWDAFGIPVGIAFFFYHTTLARTVALYPSPAGATESQLPPGAWASVLRDSPWLRGISPDVEALLVRRTAEAQECFVVPIESCYELVGRIRCSWTGFGGGPALADIESFFVGLRARSEQVSA
jgi:hypothetical protein